MTKPTGRPPGRPRKDGQPAQRKEPTASAPTVKPGKEASAPAELEQLVAALKRRSDDDAREREEMTRRLAALEEKNRPPEPAPPAPALDPIPSSENSDGHLSDAETVPVKPGLFSRVASWFIVYE